MKLCIQQTWLRQVRHPVLPCTGSRDRIIRGLTLIVMSRLIGALPFRLPAWYCPALLVCRRLRHPG